MLQFTWDPRKDLINQRKHGISFEEASTVFYDDYALIEYDESHSTYEERFRILGYSYNDRLLLVVYCIRNEDNFRIISSRIATNNESKRYGDWRLL